MTRTIAFKNEQQAYEFACVFAGLGYNVAIEQQGMGWRVTFGRVR